VDFAEQLARRLTLGQESYLQRFNAGREEGWLSQLKTRVKDWRHQLTQGLVNRHIEELARGHVNLLVAAICEADRQSSLKRDSTLELDDLVERCAEYILSNVHGPGFQSQSTFVPQVDATSAESLPVPVAARPAREFAPKAQADTNARAIAALEEKMKALPAGGVRRVALVQRATTLLQTNVMAIGCSLSSSSAAAKATSPRQLLAMTQLARLNAEQATQIGVLTQELASQRDQTKQLAARVERKSAAQKNVHSTAMKVPLNRQRPGLCGYHCRIFSIVWKQR
jgi:hypothetical protein